MNDNVIDLEKRLATDRRAGGFLNSIRAINAVSEVLGTTIAMMGQADQRFLCQIIAWRMMGGIFLPATEGLVHLPLLVGMGFPSIQAAAERLSENGVIELIPSTEGGGTMGFRWPTLEKLLAQGDAIARGPQLKDVHGRELFTPPTT